MFLADQRYLLLATMVLLVVFALLMILMPLVRLKQFKTISALALLFIISSAGLYAHFGALTALSEKVVLDHQMAALSSLLSGPDVTPAQLKAKLSDIEHVLTPYVIGRERSAQMYQEAGFYDEAQRLYDGLKNEFPDNDEYAVNALYCYSLAHQGALSTELRTQAYALEARSDHTLLLKNILAINDYFQGDYTNAIKRWQYVLNYDESLSPDRQAVLRQAILKAQNDLGQSAPQDAIAFEITVKLDDKLRARLNGNDPVYVYVRKKAQNRPTWVVKRQVDEFPTTIRLDASHAMLSETLDLGTEVEICAKTGDSKGIIGPVLVESGIQQAQITIQ